jgi:hypothetical protein
MNAQEIETQVVGKTLEQVNAMGVDFGNTYPVVDESDMTVIGVQLADEELCYAVNPKAPCNWKIVNDDYAVPVFDE